MKHNGGWPSIRVSACQHTGWHVSPYLFSLLVSTLGVWLSGGVFIEAFLAPILGHETAAEMALRPYYALDLVFGILTGYLTRLRWKRLSTPWVWVLTLCYLVFAIGSRLRAGYGL